jgi:hypothetical protein
VLSAFSDIFLDEEKEFIKSFFTTEESSPKPRQSLRLEEQVPEYYSISTAKREFALQKSQIPDIEMPVYASIPNSLTQELQFPSKEYLE